MIEHELPEGWHTKTIAQLGKVYGGKRLPKGSTYSPCKTQYPYLRVTDFANYSIRSDNLKYLTFEVQDKIKNYIIGKEDVFISIAGTIGLSGFIPEYLDGANLTENAAKITELENIQNKYLAYFLSSPFGQSQISRKTKATTQAKLALYAIEQLVVPFPTKILEQQQIVAKIEQLFGELDDGVNILQTLKQQVKVFRQSILKSAFSGELTAKWRSAQPPLSSIDVVLQSVTIELDKMSKKKNSKANITSNAQKSQVLPSTWRVITLEAIADKITDGTHHTPTYTSDGMCFISVKDIYDEIVHFDKCKFISCEEHNLLISRCNPEKGDILITKSGTIGRLAIVPDKEFSLFVSVALIKLQIANKYINNKFIFLSLKNHVNNLSIDQDIKGGVLKNYHLEDLRKAEIIICPLEEQNQIVTKIEELFAICDELDQTIDNALNQSQLLRQSILKQAFSGKLI